MKYTVVWLKAAQDQLATIWIAAPDKSAVTASSNLIDTILGQNPYANSKWLDERRRLMTVEPLTIVFSISEDDCMVTVSAVWRTSLFGEAGNGKHQA